MAGESTAPGAPGGEVQVDLEELENFTRQVVDQMEQQVRDAHTKFTGLPIDIELLGPIATAAGLNGRHRDVHAIYDETTKALAADVAKLATNLRTVIKNYRDRDDDVSAGLQRLALKLNGDGGYQADTVYKREVGEHVAQATGGAAPRPSSADSPAPAPEPDRAEPSGPEPSGGNAFE